MKNEEVKEKTTKKGGATKGTNSKKSSTTKKEVSKTTKKKDNNKKVIEETPVEEVAIEEVVVEENTSKDETNVKVEKNNSNKGDIFLIVGLVVVIVLGSFLLKGETKLLIPTYELPLTLSGEVGLQELTYQEYQEKIDNGEEFVVVIERATCSHCQTFMPVAEAFASDNGVPMYYVDTDTFTSEDWETFEKSNL